MSAHSVTSTQVRGPRRAVTAFNLIRWFSILALSAIAVVGVSSSVLLSRFLTDHMLQRDAALTMEELQTIARIENVADFFRTGHVDANNRNLREFFQYMSSMHDVLRANLYSKDGNVIWSTDPTLVGRPSDRNPELDESLAGRLTIESGTIGQEDNPKPEHENLGRPGDSFVENYIPINDSASGQLIGVAELYRVPRALFATIERGTRLIWLSALASGAFLYIVLFGIVKRADRTMRAQQRRLVEAETLAAVGQLAGAVAHGLRNPLSSIRSSAELNLDAPGARETSQDIIAEVDRLERMVRQLLLYSQAPSAEPGQVDIAGVLRHTVDDFARELAKRNVVPTLALAADLPPVSAEGALLEHVFSSLLANALDAMPKGGRLTVAANSAPDGAMVDVRITDTGSGIPAAQMSTMFKPFQTTKPKGLGIGLALAERIVSRFGGTLHIDSGEGVGTTVQVSLPRAR